MSTEIVKSERNTLSTVCIILGAVALLGFGILGAGLAFLFGVGAIVTGFISLKQIKNNGQKGQGLAIIGIILGFSPILVVVVLTMMGPIIANNFNQITSTLTP